MSKVKALVPMLILALCLTGCGDDNDAAGWTASAIARSIAAGATESLTELLPGDELYDEYITEYYGLDAAAISDGAVLAAGGSSAQEVAVLCFTDSDAAEDAAASLERYLDARQADFTGYMPAEADMLANAEVVARNAWCALIVLPDAASGVEAFNDCFESAPPAVSAAVDTTPDTHSAPAQTGEPSPSPSATPSPEPTAEPVPQSGEWSYSEARIIEAYRSGSRAGLHENDRAILEAVDHVLTEVAPEGLSDYERELAIHDYIIDTAEYDSETLSLLPFFEESPNNSNPYGALIEGRAVCRGYSSTFQLFMDLIGVECITVEGEGNLSREEHAWNMVCLDGEWYCVDVTWDDPVAFGAVSDTTAHRYFNVTSSYMRDTHHYWEASGVPEATATRYAWPYSG